MSLSINNGLRLSALPSDIILTIIDMEQESMEKMRLISPYWNDVVHKYCAAPNKAIKSFEWSDEMDDGWKAYLEIPISNTRYFGVQHWDLREYSDVENVLYLSPLFQNITKDYLAKKELSRIFHRCSRIEIAEFQDFNQIEMIDTMRGKTIDELIVYPSFYDGAKDKLLTLSSKVLDFARDHSVKSLVLKSMGLRHWKKEIAFFSAFFNVTAPELSSIQFNFTESVPQFYNEAEFMEKWRTRMHNLLNADTRYVTVENKNMYGGYPEMCVTVERIEQ